MDETMRKSGQYPNVAIIAGSDPKKVLREYDLSTTCQVKQEIDKQVDTRERLEQDIIAFVTWFDVMENGQEVPVKVEADYSTVMNWLDRQEAIAATLGGRECECDGTIEWKWTGPTTYYEHELSCGHVITSVDNEPPSFCEECGARVRKAVKR